MTTLQRLLVIALAMGILISTLELIRRRRLWEKYALLWLLTGVVLLVMGLFPTPIYTISKLLGLAHLTTMLLITFLFLLCIVLHFTTVISKQTERETELAQRLAIMKLRLDRLERTRKQEDSKVEGEAGDVSTLDERDAVISRKIRITSISKPKDSKSADVKVLEDRT